MFLTAIRYCGDLSTKAAHMHMLFVAFLFPVCHECVRRCIFLSGGSNNYDDYTLYKFKF